MKQYDLILWGRDTGRKHRTRDPITVQLDKPLYEGQKLIEGDLPELDATKPRFPVKVEEIKEPEQAGSERAFHVLESRPMPEL
jgi:hypothetical protein